uniref:Uncharacterized protein n=1 Tax=Arundo donax TaxID=35708 RepID=A0A0A9G1E4_ARUDO
MQRIVVFVYSLERNCKSATADCSGPSLEKSSQNKILSWKKMLAAPNYSATTSPPPCKKNTCTHKQLAAQLNELRI